MPLERAITHVNDDTLRELILSAKRRVVAVSPAFSKIVAEAIAVQWKRLGASAVSVILDSDPEVYRLGYGHLEGLEILEKAADSQEPPASLARQQGIRIALLISDDETLVFSPTPQLIEAGTSGPSAPNAIRLGPPPAQVTTELGLGLRKERDRTIGTTVLKQNDLIEIKNDLKNNPPQKFDLARKMKVFNSYLEFVELKTKGTQIQRKTVRLPNYILGLTDNETREQLQTTFKIVPPDETKASGELDFQRSVLSKKYLKVIDNFGTVILRSKKEQFEKELETFRKEVDAFRDNVRGWLQEKIDKNRDRLVQAVLQRLYRRPPPEWCSLGQKPDKSTIKARLEHDLTRALGSADELVQGVSVNCLFKGVTYEMLNDAKFIELLEKRVPELDKRFFEEFEAAKAVSADSDKGK